MPTNDLVRFRTEGKEKAQAICEQLGFDLPTYLRMCIAKLNQEKGIPFDMKLSASQKLSFLIKQMNDEAEKAGVSNMTLEEINNEIKQARKERHIKKR